MFVNFVENGYVKRVSLHTLHKIAAGNDISCQIPLKPTWGILASVLPTGTQNKQKANH